MTNQETIWVKLGNENVLIHTEIGQLPATALLKIKATDPVSPPINAAPDILELQNQIL